MTEESSVNVLMPIIIITAIISLCACVIIFAKFIVSHSHINNFTEPKSMVLFLAIADFGLALLSIIEIVAPECHTVLLCIFFSLSRQYITLCSFFWTAAMCHASYSTINNFFVAWTRLNVHHSDEDNHSNNKSRFQNNVMMKYHLVCWGVPMILSVLKLFSSCSNAKVGNCGMYIGRDHGNGDTMGLLWVTWLGYLIPFYAITLYILYVLTYLVKTMRRIAFRDGTSVRFQRVLTVLICTKFVFAVTCAIGALDSNVSYSMWLIGPSVQGAGDFFVFHFGRKNSTPWQALRSIARQVASRICCCDEGFSREWRLSSADMSSHSSYYSESNHGLDDTTAGFELSRHGNDGNNSSHGSDNISSSPTIFSPMSSLFGIGSLGKGPGSQRKGYAVLETATPKADSGIPKSFSFDNISPRLDEEAESSPAYTDILFHNIRGGSSSRNAIGIIESPPAVSHANSLYSIQHGKLYDSEESSESESVDFPGLTDIKRPNTIHVHHVIEPNMSISPVISPHGGREQFLQNNYPSKQASSLEGCFSSRFDEFGMELEDMPESSAHSGVWTQETADARRFAQSQEQQLNEKDVETPIQTDREIFREPTQSSGGRLSDLQRVRTHSDIDVSVGLDVNDV